jgi:MFS family permease
MYAYFRIRGNFLLGIQFFWSLGNVVVTAWAWLVLGPYGWRVMAFGCAVPMNISLIGAFFMPESPRWLMSQGRAEDAKKALLYAADRNGIEMEDFTLAGGDCESEGSLMDLFSNKYIKLNSLVWTVWFTYGFVYYGIILFTTRLFAHDDDDDADDDKTCSFDYLHLMISALVEFIALFFVLMGIEKIARNIFQSIFYGAGAIFCILFAFFDTTTVLITMFSSLIRLAVRGGLTVTWIATPELYPTHIRSSGHAIASSMVRLAGVLCPFLASNDSVSETLVCFVLFVVSAVSTVAAFFTPDSRFFDLDNVEVVGENGERISIEGKEKLLATGATSSSSSSTGSWEALIPRKNSAKN